MTRKVEKKWHQKTGPKFDKDYIAKMEKLETMAFADLYAGRLVTRNLIQVLMVNF